MSGILGRKRKRKRKRKRERERERKRERETLIEGKEKRRVNRETGLKCSAVV